MIIIGSGSRDYRTPIPIRKVFIELLAEFPGFHYKHGNAKGFDKYSDFILRRLGHTDIQTYDADWDQYGKSAGPIRNKAMLDAALKEASREKILVVAFPLENSNGTWHMVSIAKEINILVRIYNKEGRLVHE